MNHTFSKSYADDVWELYHVEEDYSEKYNVADQYPEKLEELKEEWLIEASKYHVFPMPPNGQHAYRNQTRDTYRFMSISPAKQYVYENVIYPYDLVTAPNVTGNTHTVTVNLNRKQKVDGVLFSKGDRFAGVSLYVKNNRLKYVYNADQDQVFVAAAEEELPLGETEIKLQFQVVGDEIAEVFLFVNGSKVAETRVTRFIYTMSEVTSLKVNRHISVYDRDYAAPFEYPEVIDRVVFDIAAVDIAPEEEIKKVMHVE